MPERFGTSTGSRITTVVGRDAIRKKHAPRSPRASDRNSSMELVVATALPSRPFGDNRHVARLARSATGGRGGILTECHRVVGDVAHLAADLDRLHELQQEVVLLADLAKELELR